jgi:hypothetical protein
MVADKCIMADTMSQVTIRTEHPVASNVNGVEYHQIIKPQMWWLKKFDEFGYFPDEALHRHFHPHWVRGPHNAEGFNVVLRSK